METSEPLIIHFYWIFAFIAGVFTGYYLSQLKQSAPKLSDHKKRKHHHSRHHSKHHHHAHKESSPATTVHSQEHLSSFS